MVIESKEKVTKGNAHHWVLISHKRGVARACVNCGKLRYIGKHKDYKVDYESGFMVVIPVRYNNVRTDMDFIAMAN